MRMIELPGEPDQSGADRVVLLVMAPREFEQAVSAMCRRVRGVAAEGKQQLEHVLA